MHALGETADAQVPLLVDLRKAAPSLNEFFQRLGPFSKASLPALDSLGESSKAGTAAFQNGGEEVDELLQLSKDAPGFAKPFRQFLETMDDRQRAIENDPRAKASAPPAPDPTAISDDANFRGLAPKGGFTGLEGVWDYIYWQTLSINMFDNVGHIVRLGLTVSPEKCSQMRNTPPEPGNEEDAELFATCNQYIGRHQPGINEPDFTLTGADAGGDASAASNAGTDGDSTGHVVERRGPGQLEAPPVPGRPDPSKPNVTLPPLVQELIKKLVPQRIPELTDKVQNLPDPQASPEMLLDFLLTP
jgi:hypothetical protein